MTIDSLPLWNLLHSPLRLLRNSSPPPNGAELQQLWLPLHMLTWEDKNFTAKEGVCTVALGHRSLTGEDLRIPLLVPLVTICACPVAPLC